MNKGLLPEDSTERRTTIMSSIGNRKAAPTGIAAFGTKARSFRSTAHPYHQEAPSTTTTSRSPLDPHLGIATTNDRERFRATRCHTPHRRDNHVDCHSRPPPRHSCPETPPSVHIVMHPLWQKEHKASPSTPRPATSIRSGSMPPRKEAYTPPSPASSGIRVRNPVPNEPRHQASLG